MDKIAQGGKRHHAEPRFPKVMEKETLIVLLIYTFITLSVFWPVVFNPVHTVVGNSMDHSDVYDSMWDLWWSNYAVLGGHEQLYFTTFIYYPLGFDLSLQTLMPIDGIISAPLQQVSLPFAYNIILLSNFVLSGLFTYFLALYLTEERMPSFLAGLIFAFSSVNIAHAYVFLDWTAVEWIPLFLLFFLLVIKTNKHRYVIGASISFVLVNFAGNIEEGLMVLFFALAFLYFSVFSGAKKEILNKRLLWNLIEMCIFIFLIGLPFILPILQQVSNNQVLSSASEGNLNSIYWSNDVLSFFLPSMFNGIFSNLASSYQSILFPNGFPWERISYIGYTVIFLAVLGIYYDLKRTGLSNVLVWSSLAILFAWLSLGPSVTVLGHNTNIPGIYLIFSQIPILNLLREPGRFDVIAVLCIAIIAAFGAKYLFNRIEWRGNKIKLLCAVLLSLLIFVECAGVPITQQFVSEMYFNARIPQAYGLINGTVNGTVLFLPTAVYPGDTALGMYYQTLFRMPIIGGYTSRAGALDILYPYAMPLVSISSTPININGSLIVPAYPIVENYTQADALLFNKYNIRYVVVVKNTLNGNQEQYNSSQLSSIDSEIALLSGKLVYSGNMTDLYYIPKINSTIGNATAFVSGAWVPAPLLCGGSCPYPPNTWNSTWLISLYNSDNITIYSPKGQNAMLCMSVFPLENITLGLYHDGARINSVSMEKGDNNYSMPLNLSKGYNTFTFTTGNRLPIDSNNSQLAVQTGFGPIRLLYGKASCA